MLRRALVGLMVVCSAGCNFDPKLPPDARIRCGPAPERACPLEWECFEPTGFCVPTGNTGLPSLQLQNLTPAFARADSSVTFRISSSAPLVDAPVVTFAHTRGILEGAEVTGHAEDFTETDYRLNVSDALSDGLVTILAEATTVQAITLHATPVGSFTVDRLAPTVDDALSTLTPTSARAGTHVFVRVKFAEPVSDSVRLVASDAQGAEVLAELAPTTLVADVASFDFDVPASAGDGTWEFTLRHVQDLAGNVPTGNLTLTRKLTVDTTPPMIQALGVQGHRYSRVSSPISFPVSVSADTVDVRVCLASQPCVVTHNGEMFTGMPAIADAEFLNPVTVVARDAAGNEARLTEQVTFDFTAPRKVGVQETLGAPPGCPLRQVTALGSDSVHILAFTVDETLGARPIVTTGSFPYTFKSSSGNDFEFEFTPAANTSPQTAPVVAVLEDDVGNRGTVELVDAITIDVQRPAPLGPTEQAKLLYRRLPWGAASTSYLPRYQVTAEAGTLAPDERLVFYEGPSLTTVQLGQGEPAADGSLGGVDFQLVDHQRIYAARFDSACNVASATPQLIQNVEWVGSGGTGPGSPQNPHVVIAREGPPGYSLADDLPLAAPFFASGSSQPEVRKSTGRWKPLNPGTTPAALTGRTRMASAWDPIHSRMLIFGGDAVGQAQLAETWMFENNTWTQFLTPTPLQARFSGRMVYDPDNDRFVLWGGTGAGSAILNDTWVFQNSTWTQINTPSSMIAAVEVSFLYDPDFHRVVLFGGRVVGAMINDTWELKGNQWSQIFASNPPPRRSAAMTVWDGANHRILLFSGWLFNQTPTDTWQLVDQVWSPVTVSGGPPSYRISPAVAYDPVGRRVLMFGGTGTTQLNDTWELKGNVWTEINSTLKPAARDVPRVVLNPADGSLVMLGGGPSSSDAWLFSGNQWTPLDSTMIPELAGHAFAWDAQNNRAIAFGGRGSNWWNTTWEWTARNGWVSVFPSTSPGAHNLSRMFFDRSTGRTLLFGGASDGGISTDLWELRDDGWKRLPSPPGLFTPRIRYGADIDRTGRLMIMNGEGDAGLIDDSWFLTGNTWSPVLNPPELSARRDPVFGWDQANGRFLLYSGRGNDRSFSDGGTFFADMWEYTDTWHLVSAATTLGGRSSTSFTIDPTRGDLNVFWGKAQFGGTITTIGSSVRYRAGLWDLLPGTPPVRAETAAVFDVAHDRSVVFGGANQPSLNDTWYHNPTLNRWSPGPAAPDLLGVRSLNSIDYEPRRARIVIVGGQGAAGGVPLGDSWQLEDERWTQVSAPTAFKSRIEHATVADALRGRVLVFGGVTAGSQALGDTWALEGDTPDGPAMLLRFDIHGVVPPEATLVSVSPRALASGYSAVVTPRLPLRGNLLPDGGAQLPDGGRLVLTDGGTYFPATQAVSGARLETWDPTTGQVLVLASNATSTRDPSGLPVMAADGGFIAGTVAPLSATIEDLPDAGGFTGLLSLLNQRGSMQFQVRTPGGSSTTRTPPLTAELAVESAELAIRYRLP